MKTVILSLFFTGCATVQLDNDYYHRSSVKPTLTENDLGNGKVNENIHNPFGVAIIAVVDCDNETQRRKVIVDRSSNKAFTTNSNVLHNCSILTWETK